MVKINQNNVNNINSIPEPYYELVKDLENLKQRMDSNSQGRPLTDYIKYESSQKIERNPTIEKRILTGFSNEVAQMLDFDKFMEYQIKSWEFIDSNFDKPNKNLIVDAGTGFGKTEAVIPAVIKKTLDKDTLAILIFPRHALLIDQIQRIIKYKISKTLKIGIQISGIHPEIEWTIYNNEQKNRNTKYIDYKIHTNYHFETDIFDVDYINENKDKVSINLFKCSCGGSFENCASFRADMSGSDKKHKQFVGMNHNSNSYWKCNKCGKVINCAFSREDQIALKPNILLTTIDSLPSLISDPEMGEYIKDNLKAVVFDEVHVYNSSYGGHATEIIKKINEITKRDIFIAGLSATIDMPESFGSKLFGSEVEIVEPTTNDIKKIEDKEKYIFIKSSTDENKSGDTYSLKTQNMIQTILLLASSVNKKSIAFMDSVDAVVSLSRQTNDAYNKKRLYDFRLDSLLSGQVNYTGLTCNGLSKNCKFSCTIYKKGECWNILRELYEQKTPNVIDIKGVYSGALISRIQLQNAQIIFSTSELQLGIDLPDVEYLIQYGTPYTIFDYIQRKGRAGRSIDSEPVFLFILGESSNDYVYFSYGSSILNKKYILPIEEKNEVINTLYNTLFKYYGDTNIEYKNIKNRYPNNRLYIPKFMASWLALFNGAGLDPNFASFLSQNFNATSVSVTNISSYSDMRNFKDNNSKKAENMIKDKIKELTDLLKPYNNEMPSQYLQNEVDDIINQLNQNPYISNQDIKNIEKCKAKVIEDIENGSKSLNDENQLAIDLDKIKNSDGVFGTNLAIKISKLSYELTMHATTQNVDSNSIQKEARELFFTIQSLKELKNAFQRTLNSEVIKYILRANYFYMVPKIFNQNQKVPLPVMPPVNMFSTSSREIPLIDQLGYGQNKNNENIDIRDAIVKYFPFRLNATKSFNSKIIVNPKIERKNNKFYFNPEDILDPVLFSYSNNKVAIMPLSLKIYTIYDDGVNGIISYCKNCNSFYDYNQKECNKCNSTLSKISLYASNLTENDVSAKNWDIAFNKISISEASEVTMLLKGVELSINYQYYDNKAQSYYPSKNREVLKIESTLPYGYQITTHSLKIEFDNEILKKMCNDFKDKFPNRVISEDFVKELVLHTLSHLWLKTIAITVGISPDQFIYNYENTSIIISELQEGGAGYLKAFIQYLKFRTKDVFNNMNIIVNCEEHESIFKNNGKEEAYNEFKNIDLRKIHLYDHKKITNEINSKNPSVLNSPDDYPVCYDGCLYCIGLTSCTYGKDLQFDHLSLEVAKEYVNNLIKVTNDKNMAASMVSNGGVIIDKDGGNYTVFSL